MNTLTKPTTQSDIKRNWQLIDVKGEVLGRIAGSIAKQLMGKSKPYFAKNMDCGDFVVVINARDVRTTGNKELLKTYSRYSGYPGGMHTRTLKEMRILKPEEVIRHAVAGMLPKNKLRATMLKRLYIFAGEDHKYQDRFPKAA
jgi:large subunit ribosomal protein L13